MNTSPTVLIAEDDPVFRRVMSFTVSKAGLTVQAVGDGAAALQRLTETGVDFLVTDHQMPRCSGIELLEQAAASERVTLPPTILCTAKGLELDGPTLRQRFGLVAIMHKPFSPKQLTQLILGHLAPHAPAAETARAQQPTVAPPPASSAPANEALIGTAGFKEHRHA